MAPADSLNVVTFNEILKHVDVFSRHHLSWTRKAWRQYWGDIRNANPGILAMPDDMPPALFGANSASNDNVEFTFDELHSDHVYQIRVPGLKGQTRFIGAGEGWLVAADSRELTNSSFVLINLLTREEILLPRSYVSGNAPKNPIKCNFKKIVFCRSPDHADGFFLVGLPHLMSENIAYLRPQDTAWKLVQESSNKRKSTASCEDAVIHGEKVYVITSNDKIYAYPLLEDSALGEPSELPSIIGPDVTKFDTNRYVAISGQKLFVITRVNGLAARGDLRPTRVYIYSCLIQDGPIAWDRVQCLKDTALFLGNGNSLAVNVQELSRVKTNHLYFADRLTLRDNKGTVVSKVADYDLSKRSCRPFGYQPHVKYPVWIRPCFKRIDG